MKKTKAKTTMPVKKKRGFFLIFRQKNNLNFLPIFYAKRISGASSGENKTELTVFHNAIHSLCEKSQFRGKVKVFRLWKSLRPTYKFLNINRKFFISSENDVSMRQSAAICQSFWTASLQKDLTQKT